MKILDKATKLGGAGQISDSQSGFRAYGKHAIECIRFSGDGMSAGSEILIRINENHLKTAEVPIKVRYDIEDTSSQNPLKHGILVLYNIVSMVSYRRPFVSFGIPGVIVMVIGVSLAFWVLSLYTANGVFPYAMTVICGVFLMLGLMLINTALVLNAIVTITQRNVK
jgi:hypothetical protein